MYQQIVDQIKEQIIKGDLEDNQALPSIRQLSKDLRISVITSKRAYEDLEREGYITSIQGKGSFVKSPNQEDIYNKKIKKIEDGLKEILKMADSYGIDREELVKILNNL